nr:MAG TPA: hypothetical protein [Caudoviricetes sp.]
MENRIAGLRWMCVKLSLSMLPYKLCLRCGLSVSSS